MSDFTCINCSVRFANADIQRDHYKTDWHRYNLKRKVAELPPVTAEDFQKRVLQQRNADEAALEENQLILYCGICRKHFNSHNAYTNHLNSKKHKEAATSESGENGEVKIIKKSIQDELINKKAHLSDVDDNDTDFEEVDSDEWEDTTENPIDNDNCIFCDYHSENFVENLKHMCVSHSFFLPDPEFCTDVRGLMEYLGEKIVKGKFFLLKRNFIIHFHFFLIITDLICIWCNEKGRSFFSLDAVRKHMKDKGHCKMLHEGIALAEYADFYDYSSSYPDHVNS